MNRNRNKKIIILSVISLIGVPLLIVLGIAIEMTISSKISGYRQVEATKSNYLYEKFLKSNIKNDISYIAAYSKKNEFLEIFNFNDRVDIYMWYIIKKDINVKDFIVKKGYKGKKIKSDGRTYEQRTFGTDPLFCFYNLLKFEFKDRILIKYNESQDIISEFQTEKYYMVNCYFGQLAIGSSYNNSEIMMEVFGKPKSNLAVFNCKGKILVVLAVARSGLPEIRDNYLKEILKPYLFEKGLN